MFAMAWTDGATVWLARDKFGEVPVYYNVQDGFHFCSEMKGLLAIGLKDNILLDCSHFIEYDISKGLMILASHYQVPDEPINDNADTIIENLRRLMIEAVREREISDVPICTLLSGGLDSSLITAILAKTFPDIVAYSAIYNEKSADLKAARALAQTLNIKLIEIKLDAPTKDNIERTIYCIESPLKTQIEIAYPCIKLAEAMHSDGFKVTFSGDGSDEMFGSYRFSYYGIRDMGYTQYIRKSYNSLSYRNYIRNNKALCLIRLKCVCHLLMPS
jgi:Asparagine synthase (glutamine-hydrolyzing)